jgi:hypothetical protein
MPNIDLISAICLSIITTSCGFAEQENMVTFETNDKSSSVVIKNGIIYRNPLIINGTIEKDSYGFEIKHIKKSDLVCHNFGKNFVVAKFSNSSRTCLEWKFYRIRVPEGYKYSVYCLDQKKCFDPSFVNRPFLEYILEDNINLTRFKFDPSMNDSSLYVKTSDGEYKVS